MPEIQFEPSKTTLRDMLRNDNYYVIPRFQRPFSWDGDNFADFWRDLTKDESTGYFIGPMVIWQEQDSHVARVVDGQQRLTTIMMMLCAIRDKFAEFDENDLASALHQLIQKQNDDGEVKFSLIVENGSDYFPHAILQQSPNRTMKPRTEEERNLNTISKNIQQNIDDLLSKEVNREAQINQLKHLRKQLLDLRIILITNDNEDDAYTIFETINSRGKNLEVVDLLKNHLLSLSRGSGNVLADGPKAQWTSMRAQLEATEKHRRLNPNRYLQHWWLSRNDYTSEQHLFSEFKAKITDKESAKTHLLWLERDSKYYRQAMTPEILSDWGVNLVEGEQALRGLELFGVVQPAPLLLALVRAVREEHLKPGKFNTMLSVIESFHYQYTIVSKLTSSGGVSQMYAKAARDLHAASNSPAEQADVLRAITNKLIERAPSRDQFMLAFENRFIYTKRNNSDKRIIQYTLERLTKAQHGNFKIDGPSIEHLLPQSTTKDHPDLEMTVGSIGNLLLVNNRINSRDLANKSYSEKRQTIKDKSPMSDTAGALANSTWDESDIKKRTQAIGALAFDEIWRMPNMH